MCGGTAALCACRGAALRALPERRRAPHPEDGLPAPASGDQMHLRSYSLHPLLLLSLVHTTRGVVKLCAAGIRINDPQGPDVCCDRACERCLREASCCNKSNQSSTQRCCLRQIRNAAQPCQQPDDRGCVLPPLFASVPPGALLCARGVWDALNVTCCASSCGVCQNEGCSKRGGGKSKCCPYAIHRDGDACQDPQHDGCRVQRSAVRCRSRHVSDGRPMGTQYPRKKAVLMAYTFGNNPRSCNPYFVRSFAALELHRTDLVILHEGPNKPCRGERSDAILYEQVPSGTVTRMQKTGLPPAAYRIILFMEWLLSHGSAGYEMAGVLDTDLIFQWDIFDAIQPLLQSPNDVHLVSENPIALNGACNSTSIVNFTLSRLQRPTCQYARRIQDRNESPFWDSFACSWALNLGTMFGTRFGMINLLRHIRDALLGSGRGCWDQGVLNVLVYNGTLGKDVKVWDYFEGLVKTLDIGAVRDMFGRYLNERGAPYAIVHQFKSNRHQTVYREFAKMFPSPWRARCNGTDPAWTTRVFRQPFQRVSVRDLLYDKRLAARVPGFIHPESATFRNPGDPRKPLPVSIAHFNSSLFMQSPTTWDAGNINTALGLSERIKASEMRIEASEVLLRTLSNVAPCATVQCWTRYYKSVAAEAAFGAAERTERHGQRRQRIRGRGAAVGRRGRTREASDVP